MQPAVSAMVPLNEAGLTVLVMNKNAGVTFVANRVQPPPSLIKMSLAIKTRGWNPCESRKLFLTSTVIMLWK